MCKWDMVAFYRLMLPVFLAHIPLLCFFFEGLGFFANLFWPFGGRPAAFFAQRCMNALVWFLAVVHGVSCCGMIDDLAVFAWAEEREDLVELVDGVLARWGWTKNLKKWLREGGFLRENEWQGLWYDLSSNAVSEWTMTLSEQRRREVVLELVAWLGRERGSFDELRSLFVVFTIHGIFLFPLTDVFPLVPLTTRT